MAHPFKHVGSLVIVLLLAYFLVRNWSGIKSALAGVPGAKPGGSPASLPGNLAPGGPGSLNFSTSWGNSPFNPLNQKPVDAGGIKSVIGDVNDQSFVGGNVVDLFSRLGGIDFGYGNPNPQGGGGVQIGPEHFV